MKLLLLLAALFVTRAIAQTTPAEQRIKLAEQVLQAPQKSAQAYNDLAAAFCERASETGDAAFLSQANAAIENAFALVPGDYTAQKIHVSILLSEHRWTEALNAAKSLNHRVPDDVAVWCLLAQTHLALGDYDEAQRATQWALDLRQGNPAAYYPAAQLREVYGDLEGAIDLLTEAQHRTAENEFTARAFALTELGRLSLLNGSTKRAEEFAAAALSSYPDYYLALQLSASVEQASGHYSNASTLLERCYRKTKTVSGLYRWAESLQQSGEQARAAATFREFEDKALADTNHADNANRELVFYYTGRGADPAKALIIASAEAKLRHDTATLDAYAWALFRNGRFSEAVVESGKAVANGTRDPATLAHAATINAARNASSATAQ